MDRQGHDRVRKIANELGFNVKSLPPEETGARFVTAQVTGLRPEELLNALDREGLMHTAEAYDGYNGPCLEVVTSSGDYVTFEDLNHRPSQPQQ